MYSVNPINGCSREIMSKILLVVGILCGAFICGVPIFTGMTDSQASLVLFVIGGLIFISFTILLVKSCCCNRRHPERQPIATSVDVASDSVASTPSAPPLPHYLFVYPNLPPPPYQKAADFPSANTTPYQPVN